MAATRSGTDDWSLFLRQRRLRDQLRRLRNDFKNCHCPPSCRGGPLNHVGVDPPTLPHGPLRGPYVDPASAMPMARSRTEERRHNGCEILAEARGTSDIVLHGRDEGVRATLRMSLQVHTDPAMAGRRGYYGEMYLTRPGAAERFIGFINSWRVDRSTSAWEETFLGDDGIDDGDMWSMRGFFSVLYGELPEQRERDQNGNLRPAEYIQEHFGAPWAMLHDNTDIIYIPMIWIHGDFTGRRIIDQGFELFWRLMTGGTLPEPYNLDRPLSVFLEPGLLSGADYEAVWNHPSGSGRMDAATRIRTIARAYERNGFMRLARPDDEDPHEEMGRRVDPADHPAAPGDVAMVPPDPPEEDQSTPSPVRRQRERERRL